MTVPVVPLEEGATELYGVTNYTILVGGLVVGSYLFALALVRRGRVFTGMVIASGEMVAHACLTTLTLGWGGAFHLHIVLALELGMLFTYVRLRTRLSFAAIIILTYLALVYAVSQGPPRIALDPRWELGLSLLNAAVFLSITTGIAAFYAWTVRKNREDRLQTLSTLERRNDQLQASEAALATARDEAEAASRAKSMFVANMSHELRTPLNAIIGYSELIGEEAEDSGDENLMDEASRIRGAGQHLLSLINDILDLSKVEAGHMEFEHVEFNLRDCLEQVLATTRPLATKGGNEIQVELDDSLRLMWGDPTKLRQILFNLLSNACKFTADGKVRLRVGPEDRAGVSGVAFAVIDNGIGMAPDVLERIFAEFSQADASTTRHYGGTGLGLAITRRFCEALGGSIEVESAVGRGSTFSLWLPSPT
jgi:signal transduction histidine kinase